MTTQTPANPVPRHVAIIMDGNGRWARRRGLPRLYGHREGVKSVEIIVKACRKHGVKYLTLYAFSTENWVRPKTEISGLMKILTVFLQERLNDLHEQKVRLRAIGRLTDLPEPVRAKLEEALAATAGYDDGHLILALSYGAREEITQAVRAIAGKVQAGELPAAAITPEIVAAHLYAPDVPDPDLLIRTSGELRLSNFLLWQLAYTECYFTKTFWPDFREKQFAEALTEYAKRQRRFGDIA